MIRRSPLTHKAALKSGEKKLRTRKCAVCKTPFVPRSMTHKACGPECAAVVAKQDREKAERKQAKERKEAIKSRTEWLDEAQVEVNAFIRARDANDPCISCGRFHKGQWHAGHYKSRGAHPELRFHEDNIHKQCQPCNTRKGGNALEYRKRLIEKIGLERVEWLEGPHEPAKYTIEDAKRIKATYRAKLKALKGNA